MAQEGMRFTSFYAQTVCGPSRAALMTGCYPLRVGVKNNFGPTSKNGLHPEEMTIAPLVTEDNRVQNFVAIKQDISDRKKSEAAAVKHLSRLSSLRKIDQAISNSLDLRVILNIIK